MEKTKDSVSGFLNKQMTKIKLFQFYCHALLSGLFSLFKWANNIRQGFSKRPKGVRRPILSESHQAFSAQFP